MPAPNLSLPTEAPPTTNRKLHRMGALEDSEISKSTPNDVSTPGLMEIEYGSKSDFDDDGKPRRTGNVWSCSAHIITAVIGSGVLSIPWSLGQMGWIAGPIILLLFAFCTWYTSSLLADCYRHPDPVTGKRNYIYMDAVKKNLSARSYMICGLTQYSSLVGTSIGYTITTATAARAIQKTNCFFRTGDEAHCLASTTPYIAIFGVIQIFLSQIPNFGELWWLSYLASAMSITYSLIAAGLGFGKTATKSSTDFGSIAGVGIGDPTLGPFETEAQKVWNIFIALGNMAFAYAFSVILIEIQDTMRSQPAENKQMKRATLIGILTTTSFYLTVGISGYLAFGNIVCGNILTCFETPYWLVDAANTCVIIHLIGAYQVYTQPVFQFVEMSLQERYPKKSFLNISYPLKVFGKSEPFQLNLFRVYWRTIYVIITTIVSMLIPFFNDIMGILGALGFWPLTVYFPVAMYITQHRIPRWSKLWIGLQTLNIITFFVSLAALIGSVQGIIVDVKGIKLFKAT